MSDTHPNAYRAEAAEKRKQAAQLNGEADVLESKANQLDPESASSSTISTEVDKQSNKRVKKDGNKPQSPNEENDDDVDWDGKNK